MGGDGGSASLDLRRSQADADIFRLALDIAQVPAGNVLYIENTPMFVQIAEGLGIRSILHTDEALTHAKLASFKWQRGVGHAAR